MSVLGGRTAAGTPRRADIQGLRALIDFEDEICDAGRCETSRNGTILYPTPTTSASTAR